MAPILTDGPLAEAYRDHLGRLGEIVTPTIVLYEVYKRLKRELSEEDAAVVAAQLLRTRVVELSPEIALTAADLSLEHRLAMADAIIYATARALDATVVTSDEDFEKLPGVLYLKSE